MSFICLMVVRCVHIKLNKIYNHLSSLPDQRIKTFLITETVFVLKSQCIVCIRYPLFTLPHIWDIELRSSPFDRSALSSNLPWIINDTFDLFVENFNVDIDTKNIQILVMLLIIVLSISYLLKVNESTVKQ